MKEAALILGGSMMMTVGIGILAVQGANVFAIILTLFGIFELLFGCGNLDEIEERAKGRQE